MVPIQIREDSNKDGVHVAHFVQGPRELRAFGKMMSHRFGPAIAEAFYGANDHQVYIFSEPVDDVEFRLTCKRVTKEEFEAILKDSLDGRTDQSHVRDMKHVNIFVNCTIDKISVI